LFLEALEPYIDQDCLVGDRPNPSVNSSGNPILLGAIALIIAEQNKESSSVVSKIENGITRLQRPDGMIAHKANSYDQVTKDDLISFYCASLFSGYPWTARNLTSFGYRNNWIMNNTKTFYFSSVSLTWNIAFYKLCSGQIINAVEHASLVFEIISDALFNEENASDKQLIWIKIKSVGDRSIFLRLASKIWYFRIRRTYGSVKRLLSKYHGENHPFAIYCKE